MSVDPGRPPAETVLVLGSAMCAEHRHCFDCEGKGAARFLRLRRAVDDADAALVAGAFRAKAIAALPPRDPAMLGPVNNAQRMRLRHEYDQDKAALANRLEPNNHRRGWMGAEERIGAFGTRLARKQGFGGGG